MEVHQSTSRIHTWLVAHRWPCKQWNVGYSIQQSPGPLSSLLILVVSALPIPIPLKSFFSTACDTHFEYEIPRCALPFGPLQPRRQCSQDPNNSESCQSLVKKRKHRAFYIADRWCDTHKVCLRNGAPSCRSTRHYTALFVTCSIWPPYVCPLMCLSLIELYFFEITIADTGKSDDAPCSP